MSCSLLFASLIAIPLGILISKYPFLRKVTLNAGGVSQTVPALAMLGFLVPFLGLGALPTIVVLTFYASYPILRSTYTGFEQIPPECSEAAEALGFTPFQKIRFVELPLALPVIISGLRVATAATIGIATVAAFIGAGGLGDFITQGLALNNPSLILLGAIPTAFMALGFDYGISQIENMLRFRKIKSLTFSRLRKGAIFILFFILGYLGVSSFIYSNQPTIIVGSKNFTEQYVLAELIAQLIEKKTDLKVIRKFNMGSTDILHNTLLRGDIDIYPEYTGTAYLTVLNEAPTKEDIFYKVKKAYENQFNVTWLKSFGFSNKPTLAIRRDLSEENNITTMSDLVPYANQMVVVCPPEALKRPDQLPGLKKHYNLTFKKVTQVDPNLMYSAIEHHSADVVSASATDGKLKKHDMTPLIDDKSCYIAYDAAPVIRLETLASHPEILKALEPLLGFLTQEKIIDLNAKVDVDGYPPSKAVSEFLTEFQFL